MDDVDSGTEHASTIGVHQISILNEELGIGQVEALPDTFQHCNEIPLVLGILQVIRPDVDEAGSIPDVGVSRPQTLRSVGSQHHYYAADLFNQSHKVRHVPIAGLMKMMYQREIPLSVPGGRGEMLSGLGPLSGLAQRIQVAYAFSWLSEDVLEELNHLRKLRNDISHRWDVAVLKERLDALIHERQQPIEESLADGVRLPKDFHKALDPVKRFRVRILWVMGRLTYETRWWVPAVKAKLDPVKALYGSSKLSLLGKVADVCVEATKEVCASQK